MLFSSFSYLLLASTVSGRVLPQGTGGIDPARCRKIIDDKIKGGTVGIVDCNQATLTDGPDGMLQFNRTPFGSSTNLTSVYQASCNLTVNDSNNKTESKPDPFVFVDHTNHTILSKDIDGPGKRDLGPRQLGSRPATDEPESRGDRTTGTSRLRANDYQDLCWELEQVYMVDNTNPTVGKMGDIILALPAPSAAPNYLSGGVVSKVWVCDHILELNTIDDFLNQPGDMYAFIRQQLIDPDPENCQLERVRRILNSRNNLYGVDRRVNGLKNALLQGKIPTWTNWEDFAVAGTYLYLEDKTVQAKYLDRTFSTGRALDDFKQPGDPRDIAEEFNQFARSRYATAAMSAWNEWKAARGDNHIDGRFTTNSLVISVSSQRPDRTFRPRGMNLPDLDPNDFVEPEVVASA